MGPLVLHWTSAAVDKAATAAFEEQGDYLLGVTSHNVSV